MTPDQRMLRAVLALGVLAGAVIAAAILIRHLPTH